MELSIYREREELLTLGINTFNILALNFCDNNEVILSVCREQAEGHEQSTANTELLRWRVCVRAVI